MRKKSLAPVIVFAFNRPQSLRAVLDDLQLCELASETPLYIMVDGAREGRPGEAEAVAETRRVANEAEGFGCKYVSCAECNRGLAASIIDGVTRVIQQYGRVIVVEDDLRLKPTFLLYMNQMLDECEGRKEVFQVAAFTPRVTRRAGYEADVYAHCRAMSWGWSTWSDRWMTVDWTVQDYSALRNPLVRHAFNRGGSDMAGMLRAWHDGRNSSWAIRYCWAMFRQGRVAVLPLESLVSNSGFGTEGTHCATATNHYEGTADCSGRRHWVMPPRLALGRFSRQAASHWSLWSRLIHGGKVARIKQLLRI